MPYDLAVGVNAAPGPIPRKWLPETTDGVKRIARSPGSLLRADDAPRGER
jgi:hypothetical protein